MNPTPARSKINKTNSEFDRVGTGTGIGLHVKLIAVVVAVGLLASVTRITTELLHPEVGVPLISPVLGLSVSPVGRVPEVIS
jgi:hypothetical protein